MSNFIVILYGCMFIRVHPGRSMQVHPAQLIMSFELFLAACGMACKVILVDSSACACMLHSSYMVMAVDQWH